MIKQKLYIHPMVLGGYHYETDSELDSWVKYEDISESIATFRNSLISRLASNDFEGIVQEFDSLFN